MDTNTLNKLLELGGQAGILWVAILYLTKTLKEAYETRIEALEKASDKCETDRIRLQNQIIEILSKDKGIN